MTLARELDLAERARRAGDLRHAARHAADALLLGPGDARVLALVDALLDEKPSFFRRLVGGGELFVDDGWIGNVLARTRGLWRRGSFGEAFSWSCRVAAGAPHLDLSSWILGILEAAGSLPIEPAGLFTIFGSHDRFIGLLRLRAGERAACSTWAEAGKRLADAHAGRPSGAMVAVCASAFLRRAGRLDEALAVAERGLADAGDDPQGLLRTQQGLARRALGDHDGAVEAFQRARRRTEDPKYLCEAARAHHDAGRFDAALDCYQQSGLKGGENGLAMDACRRALGRPPLRPHLDQLFPDVEPTTDDIVRAAKGDGWQVFMTDATVHVLEQARARDASATTLKLRLSCLESPSVLLLLSLVTGKPVDELSYGFTERPAHDPALPLTDQGRLLWQVGPRGLAHAAPPAPPARVSEIVAQVARGEPAMTVLLARARAAPLDGVGADDLFAALVHPPPPPAGVAPARHVFGWQRATALLLACQRADEPWLRSVRRESLRGLILGPPDWTTAAGLLALTEVLLDEPAALDDARAWLDTLTRHAPDKGHCPWASALAHLERAVPGLDPELVRRLDPWLKGEPDAPPPG